MCIGNSVTIFISYLPVHILSCSGTVNCKLLILFTNYYWCAHFLFSRKLNCVSYIIIRSTLAVSEKCCVEVLKKTMEFYIIFERLL